MNDYEQANLELVDTDELVAELRRRHEVFFLMARPKAEMKEYNWRMHWDGGLDRVLGIIEIGKAKLLLPETPAIDPDAG